MEKQQQQQHDSKLAIENYSLYLQTLIQNLKIKDLYKFLFSLQSIINIRSNCYNFFIYTYLSSQISQVYKIRIKPGQAFENVKNCNQLDRIINITNSLTRGIISTDLSQK